MTVVAWTAAGLTVLGLAVVLAEGEASVGRLGPAPLMAALIAWGLLLALLWRLRSNVVHNDDGCVADLDHALAEARENDARYRQIVETAREGIVTFDSGLTMSVVNQRASDMLGYLVGELVDPSTWEFSGADGALTAGAEAVRGAGGFTGERETTIRRADGTVVPVLVSESPLRDRDGHYAGQLGMLTDVTERKGLEDALAFQALHDTLTGLPNRLMAVEHLQVALRRATQGASAAVILIEVDGLKDLNTVHGHVAGDQLLVEIAGRLSRSARGRDTVARFGGDEFVVVSEGTGAFARTLAEYLRAALAAPFMVDDLQLDITASIGVAIGTKGDQAAALLHGADVAMLQAKTNGRAGIAFFTEALRATSRQRVAIVSELRRAVERDEFSLRFQPVVSLLDETIIGAEALIRWEHPRRGTLSPQEFVTVAEETGMIDPIGQWVIDETCRRFARWQRVLPDLSMSLNVSARQLSTGVFDDVVRDAIATSAVDPSRLALEITEGVLMEDVDVSIGTLTALHHAGVTISVDDFGTGYSSLSYLNRFPVDVLKIDQSFVAGLPDDAYDRALVQAVLTIAESLDLSVIAEGVENAAQARTLLRLGCHQAQGFHFYRPLTADDFGAALAASRSTAP